MVQPLHDWYAAAWLKHLGKKQADLVKHLDWNKAKASLTVRGKQPYDREAVNELADYLNLEPFELLLPPERAMNLRQLRASAEQIVSLAPPLSAPVVNFHDESYKRRQGVGKPETKTGTHD